MSPAVGPGWTWSPARADGESPSSRANRRTASRLSRTTWWSGTWAYELLAASVARPLFGVAHRILGDLDTAEDAVQRALVGIWRDLPRLRDLDRFDAWAHRFVVRASL